MTASQWMYLVTFSVYLVFFVLFARFFVWKRYSEKKHWNKRLTLDCAKLAKTADALQREVPFLSVLIPARNEASVIENTIKHFVNVKYPSSFLEIIVVTDEKEKEAAKQDRAAVAASVMDLVAGSNHDGNKDRGIRIRARNVFLSVLADYALKEYSSKSFQKACSVRAPELSSLPPLECHRAIRDVCIALVDSGGAPSAKALRRILAENCHWLSDLDVERIYPASLAVAVPVIATFADLYGLSDTRILQRTIGCIARANHYLTKDIISRMTGFIAVRVDAAVRAAQKDGGLANNIERAVLDMYPTTGEVVERVMAEMRAKRNPIVVKHVTVPSDFDGKLGGKRTGTEVPSTKGRALNWAISYTDRRAEILGFYDAESRPDPDALLYVGYRRMLDREGSAVLQGPVFQVRNFYQMTPFCRIAALYQAIAHDWYLPWLFRTLPFVGGTNVFVDKDLLIRAGGWDCTVLTEDLEFGARAYLKCDAWPQYLPYSSSEQTPPTFRAFFNQRLRWGTGHLQVVDKIQCSRGAVSQKQRKLRKNLIIKGQVEWVAYQLATFVPPCAVALRYKGFLDPTVVPPAGQVILFAFSFAYLGFTVYAFRRYSPHLDETHKPNTVVGEVLVYAGLFLLPLAAFVFPLPYTSALVLKKLGKEPKAWVKTPRTDERRIAI